MDKLKENKPPTPRHGRKYSYAQSLNVQTAACTPREDNSQRQSATNQELQNYIAQLERELAQERQKSKKIEEHTIREQTKVLQQIGILENKFIQVQNEKKQMKVILQQSCKQIAEYKKVKGVAEAMVGMMQKVEGKTGDYHEAWRWIKKVVWQYQSIRKKGLEWKRAYDLLKHKQQHRNDTFSNDSSDSSYQNQ